MPHSGIKHVPSNPIVGTCRMRRPHVFIDVTGRLYRSVPEGLARQHGGELSHPYPTYP